MSPCYARHGPFGSAQGRLAGAVPTPKRKTAAWAAVFWAPKLFRYRRTTQSHSVQMEIDFDVDLHGDWLVIFHGRLEAPVSYRFDSLFIQAQP